MLEILQKSNVVNEIAKEVFNIEAQSIIDLQEKLDGHLEKAVDIIIKCPGRVIVTGMGKSGHIGRKIAATLSSTGTPAYFLHPAESTHGDSGVVTRDDVVIALSNSGETAELLNLLPLIERFDVPLISLVGKSNSTLGSKSDVVLDVSVKREACPLGKAPTASTTAALAMGDALAVCLLRQRGFSEEDFLLYHPSGALGKGILYQIKDLMIMGDSLPVANENDELISVIELISQKRLGCAVIVDDNNKPVGILTDGDIRRTLLKYPSNIPSLKTKDVMTKNPKIVMQDSLAAKALGVMEKYSITSLAVCDDSGNLAGLIHVHDLLKAGVA